MDQQEQTTKEIPVEDLTVSEAGAAEVKGGTETQAAGAGRVSIQDFNFMKKCDKA